MLLSAVSVLVVAQSSSEIPEGLMNNPVLQIRLKPRRFHFTVTPIDNSLFVTPFDAAHTEIPTMDLTFRRLTSTIVDVPHR